MYWVFSTATLRELLTLFEENENGINQCSRIELVCICQGQETYVSDIAGQQLLGFLNQYLVSFICYQNNITTVDNFSNYNISIQVFVISLLSLILTSFRFNIY